MIIKIYNNNELCAIITATVPSELVYVCNYANDIIHLPFGNETSVSWDRMKSYLESRCFPKERFNQKDILRLLEIDDYDCFKIIKKTKGRMMEDNTWLTIEEDF